ncbi:MAG TPA: hypothetical protein VKC56_07260 [Gallionellaceae bacterium]|nr:hypothetical protein [Gallionellaceae bacterium]
MNAHVVIQQAQADGVTLTMSRTGKVTVSGDNAAVDRWLPLLREHKPEIIDLLKGGTTSRWWRLHYPDGRTAEIAYCPEATRGEVLACHPNADAVEPFVPAVRAPAAPMRRDEISTVRAWLALIGEMDQTVIADVLTRCEEDPDARTYFTARKV